MTGRGRTWRLALTGGCVVLLGSLTVLAPGTIVAQAAYLAGVFGSAAMALVGARRHAGRLRAAWTAVGLGLVASAVADAVWEFDVWRLGMEPDASLADIAYLASYVLLAVGLFRLPAAGTDGDDRLDVGLDSAMAGVIALLAVWQISLASILRDGDASGWLRVLWSAYPILDVVLLTLVVRLVLRRSTRAGGLFASGVVAWLVADVGFMVTAGHGVVSPWLDLGWLLASLAMGAAALVGVDQPDHSSSRTALSARGTTRMVLTTLPLLVPATVEVVAWSTDTDPNPVPMLVATVAMAGLVLARLLHAERAVVRSRTQLQVRERRARALAAHASDAVLVLSPGGTPLSDVEGVTSLLDSLVGPDEASPTDLARRMGGHDPHRLHRLLGHALAEPGEVVIDEWSLDGPGGAAWIQARAVGLVEDPAVGGIIVNLLDVTARKQAEQELTRQALYDSLTGLANRVLFRERLDHAVRGRRRDAPPPVVLYLDLDGFKTVNDSLGHDAGDELLREVASRLIDVVRSRDTVARLGGDEFAMLLETTRDPADEAQTVATRILQALSTPLRLRDRSVVASASIGIAVLR